MNPLQVNQPTRQSSGKKRLVIVASIVLLLLAAGAFVFSLSNDQSTQTESSDLPELSSISSEEAAGLFIDGLKPLDFNVISEYSIIEVDNDSFNDANVSSYMSSMLKIVDYDKCNQGFIESEVYITQCAFLQPEPGKSSDVSITIGDDGLM